MRLILASTSPRRAERLREAGYAFTVEPANVDEDHYPGRPLPRDLATFLAKAKAQSVAERFPDDVTLAADTVVAFGDTPLGKPHDETHAREMIQLLAGTTHVVVTAVAVACPEQTVGLCETALSAVRMHALTPGQIDAYVASGLWRGKAGGYGIQDANPIVTCVGGSTTNVIGLPMTLTRRLLEQAGIRPTAPLSPG